MGSQRVSLPSDIVTVVPEYRGYRFFYYEDELVIVDPGLFNPQIGCFRPFRYSINVFCSLSEYGGKARAVGQ
jgi:hypothetical protein